MSKEPQKFNEKIMQICQEKGIYFAYKSKGRELLELSKMTNEQLITKRKLIFEKVRTKVLYEQFGIEGISMHELKNLQTFG